MPLPRVYHFTRVIPASQAVDSGLTPRATPNDSIKEAGVWLSPNIYGSGTEGSFFGPIGLRVASAHLAGCVCVYVGLHSRYRSRHRFLLFPEGTEPPRDLRRQETPEGLPSATIPCELLLVGALPAAQLDGVVFGDEQGISERESQLEHARFFAHLLAGGHRLVGAIPYPHSTGEAPYGGWWTFRHLRDLLVEEAQGGAAATTPALRAVLSQMVTHGLGGRRGLHGLSAESVRQWVTSEYATAFQTSTGSALDLTADRA